MDSNDYPAITANFVNELKRAQSGEPSSLSYAKNVFPAKPIVADTEPFQVVVIGGSNYRSATVVKQNGVFQIEHIDEGTIPTFTTEELFLSFVARLIPSHISYVAVNFAHAIVPEFTNGVLDGRFVVASKEHTFAGLENKLVGQTVAAAIAKKSGQQLTVSVANDTICLLMSGLTQLPWDRVAAGIVGTGMNYALFADAETAINMEAGAFDKFSVLESTRAIDAHTARPGHYLFEKEMSGKYLADHFNYLIESKGLGSPRVTDSEMVTDIAGQQIPQVSEIAQDIFRRSAALFACGCAAITQFLNRDTAFVMQGSVFWKGYRYQEFVSDTYQSLTGKPFTALKIEHADILGAAKLVA